jgi:hypothetical protein
VAVQVSPRSVSRHLFEKNNFFLNFILELTNRGNEIRWRKKIFFQDMM